METRIGSHLSKCRIGVEAESFDTLKQMLVRGAGAAFIPKCLIAKELESGALAQIQVGNSHLPISFSFVTKKTIHPSLSVQRFQAALLKKFKRV
jgi:DNA-binding transcriptional LysR family regulator